MSPVRTYLRCFRCLTITAVDGPFDPALRCFCSGEFESMGPVLDDRAPLVKRAHAAGDGEPCDARCTSARGPSCSCPCGGKNHGVALGLAFSVCSGYLQPVDESAGDRAFERSEAWWAQADALRARLFERAAAVRAGAAIGDLDRYWVARDLLAVAADLEMKSAPATWPARVRLLEKAERVLSSSFPPAAPAPGASSHA